LPKLSAMLQHNRKCCGLTIQTTGSVHPTLCTVVQRQSGTWGRLPTCQQRRRLPIGFAFAGPFTALSAEGGVRPDVHVGIAAADRAAIVRPVSRASCLSDVAKCGLHPNQDAPRASALPLRAATTIDPFFKHAKAGEKLEKLIKRLSPNPPTELAPRQP
jgi:hypothetical protein